MKPFSIETFLIQWGAMEKKVLHHFKTIFIGGTELWRDLSTRPFPKTRFITFKIVTL